jgi:methylenetetrahydrofolate reductase (NADPH)
MPITSVSQLERIVMLSGNEIPKKILDHILKFESDPMSFKQSGIEIATMQARELYKNGFRAVHIYSMNKPDVARTIQNNLLDVIK